MKTKTKTKFLALLSVLVLLLTSLFGLGVPLLARAEPADAGEPSIPEDENPNADLTSLYYFSDYEECEDYYNGFIHDYIENSEYITHSELYYWNNSNSSGFWDMVRSLSVHVSAISNAFIIFEVRYSYQLQFVESESDLPQKDETYFGLLEDIFSRLKGQGCRIMFINGLDESYFDYNDYNAFLEYVDIHINVDFRTIYAYTALYYMTNDFSGLDKSVVFFDKRLTELYWMYKIMACYVLFTYQIGTVDNECQPFESVGLTVFLYDPERDLYYDYYGGYVDYGSHGGYTEMDMNELLREKYSDGKYYVIGNSQTLEDKKIEEMIECTGEEFEYFIFNYPYDTINDYLEEIMGVFLFKDYDALTYYNIHWGRCLITFKPLFYSEDGWLIEPRDIAWLKSFMNKDLMDQEFIETQKPIFAGIFG